MVLGESSSHSARQKMTSVLWSHVTWHLHKCSHAKCAGLTCYSGVRIIPPNPLRKQLEATFSILQARYSCNTAQTITTTHLCLIIALFRIKTGNFLVRDRHEVERVCGHAHSMDCFSNLAAQLRLFSLTLAGQIWYWYWSLLLWSFFG